MNEFLVEEITNHYQQQFASSAEICVFSPGRINLIGEHTDYNEGYVLPAAVNLGIYLVLGKSPDNQSRVLALDLKEEYMFDDQATKPVENGDWRNYLLGVIHFLKKDNIAIGAFHAVFSGDIPKGAGMSSSAALENAFSLGLTRLFGGSLDQVTLAKVGQLAEHHFVGVKCGIMDQFSSMLGQKGYALLMDCRSLTYKHVPIDLKDHQLILINSNVHHNLASSEYNVRRLQCEEGVAIIKASQPQIQSLRDVTLEMLVASKDVLDEVVFKRCEYVLDENKRVLDFTQCLKSGDLDGAGILLRQSQKGMKEGYDITCPEIDFLADFANQYQGVLGARMMGGGFGGCTINLIERSETKQFSNAILLAYQAQFGTEAQLIPFEIGDGTRLI